VNAATEAAWKVLLENGLVNRSAPPARSLESPWYVRIVSGVAGWITAFFLLGFVAAGLGWIVRSEWTSTLVGVLITGIAWLLLNRFRRNDFAVQFALALSFAGQVLVAVGIFGWLGLEQDATAAWLSMTVFQGFLAAFMPNSIHRLWSAFAATVAFYLLVHSLNLAFVSPALILGAAASFWLYEFSWLAHGRTLRPIAYGLLIGLLAMDTATGALQPLVGMGVGLTPQVLVWPWAGACLSGLVLIWVVWVLLHLWQVKVPGTMANIALSGAALLVLISLKVPGIPTGICIMLLGFAHGNRLLTGLGTAALLLYLSTYYYSLDESLLVKSQALAISGAVLLILRWVLLHSLWRHGRPNDV